MHPDLERLLSEDEAARAGVDAAESRARTEIEETRASITRQREARLRALQQDLDRSIDQMVAEADREVAERRARRDAHARDAAARTDTLIARAADLWVRIVRETRPGASR